jgi:hypothetical protein
VKCNPFEKARGGIDDLRELAEIQVRQDRQRDELTTASAELSAALAKLSSFVVAKGEAATVVGQYLQLLSARPEGDDWWKGVYQPEAGQEDGPASLEQFLAVADRISGADQTTRAQLERRVELAAEREDLLVRQRHVDQRKQTRQRIVDDAAAARLSIADFDTANARLIADAEQERLDILRDAPIRAAYDAFLPYLRRFRNELPGTLIAGLGDLARDLYNEFNRGDRDEDKLAHLYLPLTGEQRIDLAFRSAPDRRVDALQVLSEGHIRCLGLAILLAKATMP